MTGFEIFWPPAAHALLVFVLYGLLGWRRARAVRAGGVELEAFRENRGEPAESLVVKNSIANQFELPVLFHTVCILMYITESDNIATLGLAWLFVASRYAHAYVHITSNRLSHRSLLFALGFVLLVILWVWLAVWMALS
jgi:hypothetical protein